MYFVVSARSSYSLQCTVYRSIRGCDVTVLMCCLLWYPVCYIELVVQSDNDEFILWYHCNQVSCCSNSSHCLHTRV